MGRRLPSTDLHFSKVGPGKRETPLLTSTPACTPAHVPPPSPGIDTSVVATIHPPSVGFLPPSYRPTRTAPYGSPGG
ncbi:hypothetical protein NL676_012298 [Syzygium grande]|nr:hypothetical protein NL676_012298 [Syzygium grande]